MPLLRDAKSHCPVCSKYVKNSQRGIQCDMCSFWLHMTCANLDTKSYRMLGNSDERWYCHRCISLLFPFVLLEDDVFVKTFVSTNLISAHQNLSSFSVNDLNCKFVPNPMIFHRKNNDLSADVLATCVYCDPTEIVNSDILMQNVTCLHLNIRSMMANFATLVDLLSTFNFQFDFVVLSETWLNATSANLFSLAGYNCFSFPRLDKVGGGIAIFVHSRWSSKAIMYSKTVSSFEYGAAFVHNLMTGDKFVICGVYRPPRSSVADFLAEFPPFCDYLSAECNNISHCTLVITGDFNINLLTCNVTGHHSDFLECIYSFGLFPAITLPTRITASHSALIDNIFVSDPLLCGSGLIVTDISDHFPIFVAFMPKSCPITGSVNGKFCRPLTAGGLHALRQYLNSQSWDFITGTSNVSSDYDKFSSIISSKVNKFLP